MTPRNLQSTLSRSKLQSRPVSRRQLGMTLLELIIVIAVIGILAAVALPNIKNIPRRANEAALKTNLRTMRDAIDQHFGDKGHFPAGLEALVEGGYLKFIPVDPFTRSAETWVTVVFEPDFYNEEEPWAESDLPEDGEPGIEDVRSGTEELSLEGEPYAEW